MREIKREIMRERERERDEMCLSLAFQDHQLIIHLSKMQDIMHIKPNCVVYCTLLKLCKITSP